MATTMRNAEVWVSPTPVTGALDQAGFEAISDWIQVRKITGVPNFFVTDNMISQDTVDTGTNSKQKGVGSGNNSTMICAHVPEGDPGQLQMDILAETSQTYAVRRILDDAITPSTGQGTTKYALVKIGKGEEADGAGVEDFEVNAWVLAVTDQRPIKVAAS
jgi:hypothetical protein